MASSAVSSVLTKLGQLAVNEATFLLGLEDEIEHVKMNLQWLLEFLADADQKRRDTQHGLVRVWVSQLRENAYELEDVIDEYVANLDLQRMGYSGWRASPWLHVFISPKKQLLIRHDLGSHIIKINKRLEAISSNRTKYLDNIITSSSSSNQESYKDIAARELRMEVEADPTGQDSYIKDLRSRIVDTNAQEMSVISIFGMGGLGKTTLAKRFYNDGNIVSRFDLRAWLTISQVYSGIALLKSLMDQLHLQVTAEDMTKMKQKLKDHLSQKSFILVLDDMWDIRPWMDLQAMFPEGHKRIIVLLTTRNVNIASEVNPESQVIELKCLDDEHSWQLFCKKAFADASCPEEFQQFKDEVIRRCKGLPLSILTLGGLLRRRNDSNYWRKVLNNISLKSKQEEYEVVHNILAFSYDDLPRHLKACFLYVAGFPEDYDIQAKQLTRMWIAEGFIQEEEGYNMEDIAEGYLEELIQRSLIQLVQRNKLGQVSVIRVHDLVLDMARKEAGEVNFLHQNLSPQSSIVSRHLLIYGHRKDIHRHFKCLQNHQTQRLRFLHIHCISSSIEFSSSYFNFHPKFFLRVLILRGIEFPNGKCSKTIGNLIQLRYLCIAGFSLEKLPSNITNLQNLQTLDIRHTSVWHLPKKLWKISSLRHVIGNVRSNIHISSKLEDNNLDMLQTLSGKLNYTSIIKDGLQKLTNVITLIVLGVFTLKRQKTDSEKLTEKMIAAIEDLKHLTFLHLGKELASMKVLTASNTSIQHLRLSERSNEEMRNSVLQQSNQQQLLPNLHRLVFKDMHLTEDDVDVVGLLPNLKSLIICNEFELKKLVFKEGCYTCLKELVLDGCFKLESWDVNAGRSESRTMLQLVEIGLCPVLRVLPQGLHVEEIQLVDRNIITEEVKSWAEQTSKSPVNTIIEPMKYDYSWDNMYH